MKNRDRIGMVLYSAYLLLLLLSVAIVGKIVVLQLFFKPDKEIAEVLAPSPERHVIDPARGNITDCEGRPLAISCPVYQIYMDCNVLKRDIAERTRIRVGNAKSKEQIDAIRADSAKTENEWRQKASQLAKRLPEFYPDKTAAQFEKMILDGRDSGKRYMKIGGKVDWNTYCRLQELPLFKEGRYKSGMIAEQSYIRMYPYGELARRTIGFIRDNKVDVDNTHIGIEGKFDAVLHGQNGLEYLRKTDGGNRMRDNDSTVVKPVDGKDVRTTINIDYQRILDMALREQVEGEDELEGACAVLMETQTGAIRAMVNLIRNPKNGKYEETQNLAVGRKFEPGSVFKTVVLASALNDKYVKSIEETMPATDGKVAGTNITDRHIPEFAAKHKTKVISIKDGLSISSNYVFANIAVKHYGKDPMRFVENLNLFQLGDKYNFDLDGMAAPYIASPNNRHPFTNNDLGRMGYGYSVQLTPLHIVTFYNAIANKGRMMKPYLVEDIESGGTILERMSPAPINEAICSKAVADTLMRALKAVTEDGTAKKSLSGVKCPVAGKTGTSFGTFEKGGYSGENGEQKYQGTFVSFFPADSLKGPRYTMICTVFSKPTHNSFQGGGIPARVTRTVVNNLYNMDPWFRQEIRRKKK